MARVGIKALSYHHSRLGPLRTHWPNDSSSHRSFTGKRRVGEVKLITRPADVVTFAFESKPFAVILRKPWDSCFTDIAGAPRTGQVRIGHEYRRRIASAGIVRSLDGIIVEIAIFNGSIKEG